MSFSEKYGLLRPVVEMLLLGDLLDGGACSSFVSSCETTADVLASDCYKCSFCCSLRSSSFLRVSAREISIS